MKLRILALAAMMPVAAMAQDLEPFQPPQQNAREHHGKYYSAPECNSTDPFCMEIHNSDGGYREYELPPSVYLESKLASVRDAAAAQETNWHLFAKGYNGVLSYVPNLSKRVCEYLKHRALREPATDDEIKERATHLKEICPDPTTSPCTMVINGRVIQPGDISTAECFQ